jgi:hypothetical protein
VPEAQMSSLLQTAASAQGVPADVRGRVNA